MVAKFLYTFSIFFVIIACGGKPKPNNLQYDAKLVLDSTAKEKLTLQIKESYQNILGNHDFNGSILVAKNGQILYEDYKGYFDFKSKSLNCFVSYPLILT